MPDENAGRRGAFDMGFGVRRAELNPSKKFDKGTAPKEKTPPKKTEPKKGK
jgi:hypothetical protein